MGTRSDTYLQKHVFIASLRIQSTRGFMPNVKVIYGCQQYDPQRLCRYDRRAIDRRCDGCQRITDREYLESMSLWIHGISHIDKACSANGDDNK